MASSGAIIVIVIIIILIIVFIMLGLWWGGVIFQPSTPVPSTKPPTTTPPSSGGGTTTPPSSGGGTTPPPSSGGGTTTPPSTGGGTTTPPTSGGGTTTPPSTGGGTTKPPTSGGGTTTPPSTGGGTTKPPTTVPADQRWQCIAGIGSPMRRNAQGLIECYSTNNKDCTSPCNASVVDKLNADGTYSKKLTCGADHEAKWGSTGYCNPTHWCNKGTQFFNDTYGFKNWNRYRLKNKTNEAKCLRVTGAAGVPQFYPCDGAANEIWSIEGGDAKLFRSSTDCAKCLAVKADGSAPSFELCDKTQNRFYWIPSSNKWDNVRFSNKAIPTKCIRVSGADGIPQIFNCDGANNEYWNVQTVQ